MKNRKNLYLSMYITWTLLAFFVALYGYYFTSHGEYGVSAYLLLTITGLPSSLISWLLPHGSISAVFVSGLLGITQWFLIFKATCFFELKRTD